MIARVNVFTYAGAVLDAVAVGVLADAPGLGPAFLVPALILAAVLFLLPRFRTAPSPVAGRGGASDPLSGRR